MYKIAALAVALACAPCTPLFAADDTALLDTVVVTADRQESTLADTLAPMIVIDRAEIERAQAGDVAELLRFHAGLDIARTGGPGQTATVFLRGTDSNHVLVLIDGVEINPGTIGGAPFTHISPDMIERIEVVKGPRSALYGSEAIGGVINIITRKGSDGLRLDVHAGGGSFGTTEGGASLRYGDGTTTAGLSINHSKTDGFPPRTGSTLDAGYDNTTVNANVQRQFDGWALAVRHWQTEGTNEYLDFLLNPVSQDFLTRTSALEMQNDLTANWSSLLSVSQARNEITQNQSTDAAITLRDVLDWQHDLVLGNHQLLTAGVYLAKEDTESVSAFSPFAESVDSRAIYLQDSLQWGKQQLELAARHTDHDAFGTHTSWNAAWGIEIADASRLSLAAGSAFRAPDSTDRFGFGGNPNLAPEVATNLEISWRQMLGRNLLFNVAAFHNEIDDLIAFDPIAFQSENIEQVIIRGLETTLRWQTNAWNINIEASYQQPENLTTNQPLLRRAEQRLALSVVRAFGKLDLGLDFLANGPRPDIDPVTFATVENPGYGLVNLTAGYRFNQHWTLRARLENITDKQYSTALGYETADRSAYLTVQYSTD